MEGQSPVQAPGTVYTKPYTFWPLNPEALIEPQINPETLSPKALRRRAEVLRIFRRAKKGFRLRVLQAKLRLQLPGNCIPELSHGDVLTTCTSDVVKL